MMALSAPKLSVLTDGSGRSFVDASEEALMEEMGASILPTRTQVIWAMSTRCNPVALQSGRGHRHPDESVTRRWRDLGFTGTPPTLWALDE